MSWPLLTGGPVQAMKLGRAQRAQEGADLKVAKKDKNCKACYTPVQCKAGDEGRLQTGKNKQKPNYTMLKEVPVPNGISIIIFWVNGIIIHPLFMNTLKF